MPAFETPAIARPNEKSITLRGIRIGGFDRLNRRLLSRLYAHERNADLPRAFLGIEEI